MIIEISLKIILVVVAISLVQIAYNSLVYRQIGKLKWVKFISVVVAVALGSYLLFVFIKIFTSLRYVSSITNAIDAVIFTFIGYLPKKFLIIWFVVPLVITWIVYLFITIATVIKNRYKYFTWKKRTENDEKNSSYDEKNNEKMTDIPSVETASRDNVHFLSEPMTKIRYKSILGLQRAYEVAKEKGLQLTETENGYVAVYADKSGVLRLKEIMAQNGIDHSELENRPSIVFFDLDTIKCVSIKEAFEKMKGGESIV